jgi:hypothetical protein
VILETKGNWISFVINAIKKLKQDVSQKVLACHIHLLPGIYSMPIHAVPKPHSTNLCLVTNHSAGNYSLNSMIKQEDIAGFPLDNMTHLGKMLLRKRKEFPDKKLLLFKSNILDAYRHLPMHPLWQIK